MVEAHRRGRMTRESEPMSTDADYTARQVNELLEGAVILGATVGDAGFPAIQVRAKDGTLYWLDVQADAEGNGPGFLNIEPTEG